MLSCSLASLRYCQMRVAKTSAYHELGEIRINSVASSMGAGSNHIPGNGNVSFTLTVSLKLMWSAPVSFLVKTQQRYKPDLNLLVPHVRFTIAINTKAREQLICECGLFDKANGTGGGGHVRMVQRAMSSLTYKSFCFPESIKMRGLDSTEALPYYYYRDDGLRVWEAVQSFVTEVVNIYYDDDKAVQTDTELQAFVKDVFVYGLKDNKSTDFLSITVTIAKVSLNPWEVEDKSNPAKHCPVNLLLIISKLTEGVINLLSDAQFGFRQGHSASDLITALFQTWTREPNSRRE
eukprot:g42547.t1